MCQRSQCKTLKLLEETQGKLQDTIMENDFLNRIPETQQMTARPEKWDCIKSITVLYTAQGTAEGRDNLCTAAKSLLGLW